MRRTLTVLITGTVLLPLAACGSDPASGPPAPAASPSTASPSIGDPAATTPAPPAGPPGTGPTRPPTTTTATPPGPPDAGELPGGLPHGDRKLTGVVERSGDCAMLRVGDRLWSLTGSPAQTLRPGERVTVQGQITTADGVCAEAGATRGIVVRRVTEG